MRDDKLDVVRGACALLVLFAHVRGFIMVDYLDAENTSFVSSFTDTGAASLRYNLTEKDQLTMALQAVDYTRKDNLGDVQLFDTND